MKSSRRRGFTLIELLVVISIISLISSVIFSSVNNGRVRARDSRRKQDIKSLATAINLYYDKNLSLPVPSSLGCGQRLDGTDSLSIALISGGFIPRIPTVPSVVGSSCGDAYYANPIPLATDPSLGNVQKIAVYMRGESGEPGCMTAALPGNWYYVAGAYCPTSGPSAGSFYTVVVSPL